MIAVLKAILFDLDNTLLDFITFKRETALAAAKAIRKAGVEEDEQVLYRSIFKIYNERGIEYQMTFHDLLSNYQISKHLFEHAKQAAIVAYTKKKYELLKPRPKVIQTLNTLKSKYKLAIVTDAPREKAWQRLILAGLDHYFYPVVTYSDTLEEKPSPKPFLRALGKLGISPKEALFVGDNQNKDILGAKKAGMTTCLAKYGCQDYCEEEDVSDYSIRNFEELLKVVKEAG